jgi:hypothetical protein
VGTGGRFTFNDETSGLLLSSVVPLIHIGGNVPQVRTLRSALDLITFETEAERPGGAAIGTRLCAIVVVNILRAHLLSDARPLGWLEALSDRQIGTALKLMHGDVARRWKIAALATESQPQALAWVYAAASVDA